MRRRRRARGALTVSVLSRRQRAVLAIGLVGWFAALFFFWSWWLQAGHVVTVVGMVVNSVMFVWTMFLPGVFFAHLWRMRRMDPAVPVPDLRAAMIVTKAPSEPWPVVRRTLQAMLRQAYPHPYDVWLADEAPEPETLRWCAANGVQVSTRHGRADYHRPAWPRRTKSKEGNLAFFYDNWGYDRYDVVAQLDADHRPTPGYLAEMVRPFADPDVGYVAAPSICDANARVCWAARGRLYKEAVFHGPQQAGGHHAIPPVCIGSHYAVRTQAVREIGGIGPELAEDFSTSLLMNAFGWSGVFALDAEAHGDGPETFADFVTQEFQWARSLSDVMLHHTRPYWKGLDRGAKLKLGFGELWYPLYALHMLAASLFPIVALATGTPWADVRLLDFFAHTAVVATVLLVILEWVRRQGWLRPVDAPLVSWETALFLFTRWPWVLWGVVQSVAGKLLRRRFSFKVTPKGLEDAAPIGLRAVMPYLLISAACAVTAILVGDPGAAGGYYYFCLLNAIVYAVVAVAVVALHLHEFDALRLQDARRLAGGPVVVATATAALVVTAVALRGGEAVRTLLPPRIYDALTGAPARVGDPFGGPVVPGAPPWLVLLAGLGLLLTASRFAARVAETGDAGRTRSGAAALAGAGLSSVGFVALVALWARGAGVSWGAFAAVLALGALSAAVASRRVRAALPAIAREAVAASRPDAVLRTPIDPVARPRLAGAPDDEPAAMPLPEHWRRRRERPSRTAVPATGAAQADRATTAGWDAIEAEIAWWSAAGEAGFEVRPTEPGHPEELERDRPTRSPDVSRAHALLYDRLVLEGWRPVGRGDAWYAHRFRRTAPTTAPDPTPEEATR